MVSRLKELLVSGLCLALLGGCTPVTQAYESVMGDTSGTIDGRFYVATAGLPLHAEPSFSSEQIGELDLHEAVDRDGLSSGFAHVTVVGSGKEGWVQNAKLTWRGPKTSTVTEEVDVAPTLEPTVAIEPPLAPAEPAPGPPTMEKAPTAESEDEKSVDPALFDAF